MSKPRPMRIQIDDAVIAGLEKHAISNLTAEVGGMLFGSLEGGVTIIDGFVPATNATTEQISLTFTHEVWGDILEEGEKFFPGKQIVGWYHTHPSFGIFLSDYDQFIQQNFFNVKGQLALVLDPILGRMGWFENKGKKVSLISEEDMMVGPQAQPKTGSEGKRSTLPFVMTGLVSALVASALSVGLVLATTPPNLSQALVEEKMLSQGLTEEVAYFQNQLGYLNGDLVLDYMVTESDSLESIAIDFYGDAAFAQSLADQNGLDVTKTLDAGTILKLVAPKRISLPEFVEPEELSPASPSPSPSTSGSAPAAPSPSPSNDSAK